MQQVQGVGNNMFVMRESENCDNVRIRESVYAVWDGMKSLRITKKYHGMRSRNIVRL